MAEIVLQTNHLTKTYSGKNAVDDVSIAVRKGDVYGLIGRNGAGKTTLIRLITGLAKSDSGDIALFGESAPVGLTRARGRLGCVIESPALYPNLSARDNLAYFQKLWGVAGTDSIDEALATVGLADAGKKKFRSFSLGMKQRLALGLALLRHPDFLILDEPVNGLDPIGIIEIRETLKRLNQEDGITILISSHILSELSLIATRYGIINNGKLIKELTNDELQETCQHCLSIVTDDSAKTATVLETILGATNYKITGSNEVRLYGWANGSSTVMSALLGNGVKVSSFSEAGDNLEEYFVSLIGEERKNA